MQKVAVTLSKENPITLLALKLLKPLTALYS